MFNMLTADAANKHGHEFSHNGNNLLPWAPRLSPLRVLSYRQSRPARNARSSLTSTMADLREEPEETDLSSSSFPSSSVAISSGLRHEISFQEIRMPGAFDPSPPSSPPALVITLPESSLATSLSTTLIPEEPTAATSITALMTDKRLHRSKTRYEFAHPQAAIGKPASTFLHLHTRTALGFYKPAFEVFPLDVIDSQNGNVMKNVIWRIGKQRASSNSYDFAIFSCAHDLSSKETAMGRVSNSTTALQKNADLSAQIAINSDSWTITRRNNKTYDIMPSNTTVPCARWYIPKASRPFDPRYYFAAMTPNTKQHPTLASLSKLFLDVYHTHRPFTSLSSSTSSTPISSHSPSPSTPLDPFELDDIPVNDTMRKLIIVSAIWLTFCEEWTAMLPNVSLRKLSAGSVPSSYSGNLTIPSRPKIYSSLSTPCTLTPVPSETTISTKSDPGNLYPSLGTTDQHKKVEEKTPINLIQDNPTVQFRHLLELTNNSAPSSIKLPRNKIQTLIRRRSTASSAPPPDFSRPAPTKWIRRLSWRQPTPAEVAEASRPIKAISISISETETIMTMETAESTNPPSFSVSTVSSITPPGPPVLAHRVDSMQPESESEPIYLQDDCLLQEIYEQKQEQEAKHSSLHIVSLTQEQESRAPEPRYSSDEEEEVLHPGVQAPYWRAFDLMLPHVSRNNSSSSLATSSLTPSQATDVKSVSETHIISQEESPARPVWFSGLRGSIRRR